MSSWARPGVKCVCIENKNGAGTWVGSEAPIIGAVYTVANVWIGLSGNVVVDFVELKRSDYANAYYGKKMGYHIERFRPLITRTQEQDVAIFTPLLTATPVREPV